MSDFINKVISIALIFIMLVLAPLVISYKTDEMMAKREILNDVSGFIDMVKDTGTITQENLDKLYIDCNSHGMAVDVKVKRKIRSEIMVDMGSGEMRGKTVYNTVDKLSDIKETNRGDVIQVTIEEIGISTGRRLIYNVLKLDEGKFQFSLAGTVG